MCTQYGCTCPAGLTGRLCDEGRKHVWYDLSVVNCFDLRIYNSDCLPGEYGADCKQTCSPNCHNNTCDQYTGVCSQGCSSPGYLPPFCSESKTNLFLLFLRWIALSGTSSIPAPKAPSNVNRSDVGEIYVTLQWNVPWIFNGVLKTFIVKVERISAADMNARCSDVGPIEIPFEKVAPYAHNVRRYS